MYTYGCVRVPYFLQICVSRICTFNITYLCQLVQSLKKKMFYWSTSINLLLLNCLILVQTIRAKYIVGTVKALQAKPGGGAEWLTSLRGRELNEVIDALCTLPGVGPKVAACIALFSLDQHHAIPVDTHVWQVCFLSCICIVFSKDTLLVCASFIFKIPKMPSHLGKKNNATHENICGNALKLLKIHPKKGYCLFS